MQVTIKEIFSDLQQYSNGFPKERIPHNSRDEKSAKTSQQKLIRGLMHGERISSDLIDFRGNDNISSYQLEIMRKEHDLNLKSIHQTLQDNSNKRKGTSNIRVLDNN